MRILIVVFAILLIYFDCLGQSKNYVITATGDSLYGKIKLKNGIFTIISSSGKQEINADNIRKVYSDNFKGTAVVHCILQLYTDNISELELGFMPLKQKDTVMVLKEIYTTDKINLYFGTDDLKSQYYFYKTPADPSPVQLVVRYYLDGGLGSYSSNRAAYRGEKSRIHIEVDKGYVNQLKNIMGDCEMISEATWELLDYRDYSLKNLIKKYNSYCD
jgi:hypothetical protein